MKIFHFIVLLFIFSLIYGCSEQSKLKVAREKYDIRQYKQAFEEYMLLANKGNAEAQFYIGLMFLYGDGIEKNEEMAYKWFSKAAKQDLPQAQYNISIMYFKGIGVTQNPDRGFLCLLRPAYKGIPEAQIDLASCYYSGTGVKKDLGKSIYWLEKAAQNNSQDAQIRLGNAYYRGDGVEQNYKTAFEYAQKAAIQKNSSAQYMLAIMYIRGDGTDKNVQEGFKQLCMSAKNNNDLSQIILGVLYLIDGQDELAEKWFAVARKKGNPNEFYFHDEKISFVLEKVPTLSEFKKALALIRTNDSIYEHGSKNNAVYDAGLICKYVLSYVVFPVLSSSNSKGKQTDKIILDMLSSLKITDLVNHHDSDIQ